MKTDTSAITLSFDLTSSSGSERAQFSIGEAVIAGWTGRDAEAVEKHIRELEKLGIQRPASTRPRARGAGNSDTPLQPHVPEENFCSPPGQDGNTSKTLLYRSSILTFILNA